MQASELRIGSIIKLESSIVHVTHFDIRQISRGSVYEPIPLTPEILEACGFNKVPFKENIYTTIGGGYQIAFAENRNSIFYIYIDDFKGYCYACGILYYLHQLQNLYFTLTSEELTINFPVMSKSE